jgi:flagellar L-ring protein precursor FlgH
MKAFSVPCCYLLLFACLWGCSSLKEAREIKKAPMPKKYVKTGRIPYSGGEGSLWYDSASLYEDKRARHVNDIVTILISEATSASKKATTNNSSASSVNDSITNLMGIPSSQILTKNLQAGVQGTGNSAFKGEGDTARTGNFTATLSGMVTEVLPNSYLVIESRKEVIINNDKEIMVLRGIIRPEDITTENTIYSYQVADAQMYLVGDGVLDDKQSQGWLARIMDKVWPF